MKKINTKILQRFLKLAGDRLEGDWVLLGGTVLPLLGISHRVTLDIDVVGPKSADNTQLLQLMTIAQELELPVEAINQAGTYFLYKIKNWEKELVLLHQGKKATFLRPNTTLFLLLKLSRLTESDLLDCLAFLKFATKNNEAYDQKRLYNAIQKALKDNQNSAAKKQRLEQLRRSL